jgi:hypothetical protein
MSKLSFKRKQYLHVESLIKKSNVFFGDIGYGEFRGKQYPFILQDANSNLFIQSRDSIQNYFKENGIAWWNGKLTNHPLSSQIACLNHLFPIREDKNAVLAIIKKICPDIEDVLLISTDKHSPAYIQFEAVSDNDHLNEVYSTRGSNCTSVDALIYGTHKDGRKILFPIEWKYVEAYNNENKANGDKGTTRKLRYTDLINKSAQLRNNFHDVYYFEPFYQLMRQTLWAEQMIANNNIETIKADDFIHIHVIPGENSELLNKTYPCSGKGMEETWRSCIMDQSKYIVMPPKELLTPVDAHKYSTLLEYLNNRYW